MPKTDTERFVVCCEAFRILLHRVETTEIPLALLKWPGETHDVQKIVHQPTMLFLGAVSGPTATDLSALCRMCFISGTLGVQAVAGIGSGPRFLA